MLIASFFSGDRFRKCGSRPTAVLLSAVLTIGGLSGCSLLVTERERYLKGWRPGRIVQIDAGAAIQLRLALDCRKGVPADVAVTTRYALVQYTIAPSRYGYWVTPVSWIPGIAVGYHVEVNVDHCEIPMVKLI